MNKVYIIRYEEETSGEYSSGVLYVYESLEKAKNMLNEILKEELMRDYMIQTLLSVSYGVVLLKTQQNIVKKVI